MTDYFMVDAEGNDDEAYATGLVWLQQYAERTGAAEAAIVVPSLRQVEVLAGKLGVGENILKKQRQVRMGAVNVRVMITKDMSYAGLDGPVLGIWVDDKLLPKMEQMRPSAICAIPWLRKDIDKWKAARSPKDLRTGARVPDPVISNPVVEVALRHLTNSVNLSTGITHPSDKDHAVGTFRTLHAAGERYDTAEVRAWAVANGWHADGASALADIASRIDEGRTVRTYHRRDLPDGTVERWRAEVQGVDE